MDQRGKDFGVLFPSHEKSFGVLDLGTVGRLRLIESDPVHPIETAECQVVDIDTMLMVDLASSLLKGESSPLLQSLLVHKKFFKLRRANHPSCSVIKASSIK